MMPVQELFLLAGVQVIPRKYIPRIMQSENGKKKRRDEKAGKDSGFYREGTLCG